MHDAHHFLEALTLVLCTAGVTTVLFQRLRQPVVLGYILAGLIVGPYIPIPLVADRTIVETLSELGVIMLMFSLGLEFSLRKLVEVLPKAGLTAVVQSSIMVWLGYLAGQAFGWTGRESLFTGAIVAISSTTIIAKAFDEQGIGGKIRELVVGVLIVEDLIAILLMAMLTALASPDGLSASTLAASSGRLAAFLAGLLTVGLLVVPRLIRSIARRERPETLLVASIGVCFASALLAQHFGYSVALGAFIAGSLIAESGEEQKVEHLIVPVRDMFAAIFFVSVGMLIDPAVIVQHYVAILVLTVVVIVGKIVGVTIGAFMSGNGTRVSIKAGMSLAQIGEFSFIIAALGISLKATGEFLYPIAAAVSALTTLTTPWLIRASGPVAAYVDRKLPASVQTFAALYGGWVEQLRASPDASSTSAKVRRLLGLIMLDAALLGAIVIGASVQADALVRMLSSRMALSLETLRYGVWVISAAIAVPFVFGVVRLARQLGLTLAFAALPAAKPDHTDVALIPRRALMVTLELATVLLVMIFLLVFTQPFVPRLPAILLFAIVLAFVATVFLRSATNLHGHVRASAQLMIEGLVNQARKGTGTSVRPPPFELALAGLGEPTQLLLDAECPALGKSLAEINLRGFTGATVIAIMRGEQHVLVPVATEVLRSNDVLVLAGTHDAVTAARELLGA